MNINTMKIQNSTNNSLISNGNIFFNSLLNDTIYNDPFFYILVLIGTILLTYGTIYHFYLYDSTYVPVKAVIVEATCDRVIVNRRRDEYYCLMTIEYVIDGKTISNTLQTHSNDMYYVGTELSIYVNRNNPVDMQIPFISQKLLVLLLALLGVMIIIIALGIKFLHV